MNKATAIRLLKDHPISEFVFSKNDRGQDIFIITGATIIYPNFTGREIDNSIPETELDRNKKRNFRVFIDDPDIANKLNEMGCSISYFQDQSDENGIGCHTLKVKPSYQFYDPKVILHSTNGVVTDCDKETAETIDKMDIIPGSCYMIVRPSYYKYAGREGLTCYLEKLEVTIRPVKDYYTYPAFADEAPEE